MSLEWLQKLTPEEYSKLTSQGRERSTELEFLKWFFSYADFGPADGDVRDIMYAEFKRQTGKELPLGYGSELEERNENLC